MVRREFLKVFWLVAHSFAISSMACTHYKNGNKCLSDSVINNNLSRIEPIFNLKTPLLFAHRGGAGEVPESTIYGFEHAIGVANSDVLELDVQMTKDGKIVVWHGPELNNVRIENEKNRPSERCRDRTKIYDYSWKELEGKAWVADPEVKDLPIEDVDLSNVPKEDKRCLMLLSDFLEKFNKHPLNIELKESFSMTFITQNRSGLKDNIETFVNILDKHGGNRKVVVVSLKQNQIDEFRRCTNNRYSTGLTPWEQFFFTGDNANKVAFETSYVLINQDLVKRVREACGSIFVFITSFGPIPAIDKEREFSGEKLKIIFDLLNIGVDGIMTDRPREVRKIIDFWVALKKDAAG
jgi:glycerophosphoryl diester phosphodiesterase